MQYPLNSVSKFCPIPTNIIVFLSSGLIVALIVNIGELKVPLTAVNVCEEKGNPFLTLFGIILSSIVATTMLFVNFVPEVPIVKITKFPIFKRQPILVLNLSESFIKFPISTISRLLKQSS